MTYLNRLDRAAELLRAGRLVAFPTETVYGLGANALDPDAVALIFKAKGRPFTSPLIVHVANTEAARELAVTWSKQADQLAQAFWPGPLTIIVPKAHTIPDIVTAGLAGVGLRVPAHPLALALLQAVQLPLAAPSANRFTHISPTTADHVRNGLGNRVDLILDGGPCTVGIESTVLSLTAGPTPKILRPGMISQSQIEAVIGPVETGAGAESPGQHHKHYSPRTPVYLDATPFSGEGFLLGLADMPKDPAAYAEQLYAKLHELDAEGHDWIRIEMPPDCPAWAAVRDRLQRAAG